MWMSEFVQPGQVPGSRPRERRAAASLSSQWMGLVLEELDHGVVLLNGAGRVLHANLAARASLDANHPLELVGQHLRARLLTDAVPLAEALEGAEASGRRCLLRLGDDRCRMRPRQRGRGAAQPRRQPGCRAADPGAPPALRRPRRAVVRAALPAHASRDRGAQGAVQRRQAHRGRPAARAWPSPRCAARSRASAPRAARTASAS